MAKYLEYEIENLEPIKTSGTLMQSDSEYSKGYISGSVIKGAYIYNYMNIKKVNDINTGEHKKKLLKGDIKFLNAYPVVDGFRSYPFPCCYYARKSELKEFKASLSETLKINSNMSCFGEDDNVQKVKGFEFAKLNFRNNKLIPVTVKKNDYLHIKKASKNENNKIFRYEAIEPLNKFKGIVEFTGEHIEENIKEFKEIVKDGVFYVGGSKGTGYGLCKIQIKEKIADVHPEWTYFYDNAFRKSDKYFDKTEKIYLYALSDIIFRDSFGMYKSYIDPETIEEQLGEVKIELKNSFVQTEVFTGFNSKWGYRVPLVNGIKAGSIIEYSIKGNIDFEALKRFVINGIGDRKIDGFGRFTLLNELDFKKLCVEDKKSDNKKLIELKNDEKHQMQNIVNKIYNKRLESALIKEVAKIDEELNKKSSINKIINSSQWGKLFSLMSSIEGMECNKGQEKVKEYFDNIYNKSNNRELRSNMDKIKIENLLIKDYINNYISDSYIKSFYSEAPNRIEIGNVASDISEKEKYQYQVRVLKELFRMQLKDEEEGVN